MINPDILTGRLGNRMFQMAFLYALVRRGQIPDWYVQNPAYFDEFRTELQELFGESIGSIQKVGIHVRRAANPIYPKEPKYSENPFYVNLSNTDYYERAMALFPDKEFLLFSDDIPYCKEHFKDARITIIEGGTELSDFNQLASCEHQIIANSSFSWWAAYLNRNPNKKVIAPKEWYADGKERTFLPSEWTRI